MKTSQLSSLCCTSKLILSPICIVSKSSDPDGHELPFFCARARSKTPS